MDTSLFNTKTKVGTATLLFAKDGLSTDRASIRPSIVVVLNDALLLLGKEMVIRAASSQSPKYYYCYYYYYYCCCYYYFLHTVIIAMVQPDSTVLEARKHSGDAVLQGLKEPRAHCRVVDVGMVATHQATNGIQLFFLW